MMVVRLGLPRRDAAPTQVSRSWSPAYADDRRRPNQAPPRRVAERRHRRSKSCQVRITPLTTVCSVVWIMCSDFSSLRGIRLICMSSRRGADRKTDRRADHEVALGVTQSVKRFARKSLVTLLRNPILLVWSGSPMFIPLVGGTPGKWEYGHTTASWADALYRQRRGWLALLVAVTETASWFRLHHPFHEGGFLYVRSCS